MCPQQQIVVTRRLAPSTTWPQAGPSSAGMIITVQK
jgi:hypothetical protein